MKCVDNPSVKWSALDIEAHIEPIIEEVLIDNPLEHEELVAFNAIKDGDKMESYFHGLIEEVFEVNQEVIIEFINQRIQDHLYYNREEIINEIKSLIKK